MFRRFCPIFLLAVALCFSSCATKNDEPWMPVSEVTAPHAPFYTQAPGKNGPTTAPFIYLQQGTGVRPSGKVKDDYSEITLVNQLKGWVSGDLLGSISSER